MKQYKKLVKYLNKYIEKDDIIYDEKFISAYTLYNIIKTKLTFITDTSKELKKDNYDLKIDTKIINNKIILTFYFTKIEGLNRKRVIRNISKDINSSTLIAKTSDDKKFLLDNMDIINKLFVLKQELYTKYNITSNKHTLLFNDDILKVLFSYGLDGNIDIDVTFDKNKYKSYNHNLIYLFYTRDIDVRKIAILKKFKIEINKLDEGLKLLIKEYFKDDNKIKRRVNDGRI